LRLGLLRPESTNQTEPTRPKDTEGRPGRGALQLARRKLRLLSFQTALRDAVEQEADELAKLRATARPLYQQVRAGACWERAWGRRG
jgi:hypothetical protein